MKRSILLSIVLFLSAAFPVFAQSENLYEAELLSNPTKGRRDTREVNAILIFEKDLLKIVSRRRSETFKTFKYSEIKAVEHSFSKNPLISSVTRATILSGLIFPYWQEREEKHWLAIATGNDFAVLKIENDNYRLIKMEFVVRDLEIDNVNEDRQ